MKLKNKKGVTMVGLIIGPIVAVITVGHIQYERGKWGKNGSEAVHRCTDRDRNQRSEQCWYENPEYQSMRGLNVVRDIKPSPGTVPVEDLP